MIGLRARWPRQWLSLGATAIPDVSPLLAGWAEPHRHYHSITHLSHCLATYDRNPLRDARVELALWFHDAIYDPKASDNEQRCADWARKVGKSAGLTAEAIEVVATCILATRHREPPASLPMPFCGIISALLHSASHFLPFCRSLRNRPHGDLRYRSKWRPGRRFVARCADGIIPSAMVSAARCL